jgi:hypothetical protein
MAKAGMEKLHAHAEEHLSGGVYDDPTPAMVNAANTIDRIESFWNVGQVLFFQNFLNCLTVNPYINFYKMYV